ncbi:MAG: hypothetical protein CMG07_00290 [Candidatus Marinimicrobia bacterium]|nr:hypothetical protein [Candidatus Neomarinimicrobiota bacterium]
MKIKILVLTFINSFLLAHGGHDHKHTQAMGSIFGSVIDSLSNKPIEYVSISVMNKQTNEIISGNVTDNFGKFIIKDIYPGNHIVKFEFMGYNTKIIEKIVIRPRGKMKWDLGVIKLEQTLLEMDEVTIIDKKPIFEFETDKMIYNSSDDIVAGSGTAEDVLNKVPMVTVDQDGEVSLRGNPNVKILVNGRPNRSGGEVDNIPASLIDKIEIITSPSAKYDPEGMAGIINIVLKKGRFEGLNGSIKVNGKHNTFNSFDNMNGTTFYANYRTDRYNTYGSISFNNRARTQRGFREVYNDGCIDNNCYVIDDKYYDIDGYNYTFKNNGLRSSNSFKIGTDYSITKYLTLNGELSYRTKAGDKTIKQSYEQDGISNELYEKISTEGEQDGNYHLESFFEIIKSDKNPDKELYFSISGHKSIDNEYESLDSYLTTISETENNFETDFNFKYPLNDKSKLEFGYDGRFMNTSELLDFELYGLDGINDFSMKRNIHGFFGEYQVKINDKFSLKPSLRVEFVDKNIIFEIQDTTISDQDESTVSTYVKLIRKESDDITNVEETNIFPNFNLTYNITDKKSLQFGVSKRIERPAGGSHGSWGQLRPFPRNVYNDSFIFMGKPSLEPEFSTQYEINYRSPLPMGFFSSSIYFRDVTNSIEWYNDDELDANVVTFRNAEKAKDIGFEAFMMIMGQTIGGSYNINELNDSSNDFQLNGKNERLSTYMRINLPEEYIKIFGFEFGFYYMKIKTPGGTLFGSKGTLWANTGISKSFLDNRLSLSSSINNIFDKGGFQMFVSEPIENGITQFNDVYSSRGGRTFAINLKYNFGKMQEDKSRNRNQNFGGSDGGGMDMGY